MNSNHDPLTQLVASKEETAALKPYKRADSPAYRSGSRKGIPNKRSHDLDLLAVANYYKLRWLAAYNLLTPEQRHENALMAPEMRRKAEAAAKAALRATK